jgi:serine/threonine protein kinase/Flp pilus assembly protein TadD
MKNEFREKVEQIFHNALDLSVEDRNSYLQQECAGDITLFSEVESLLHNFELNAGFLEEPVFELGLQAVNGKPEKNLSGSVIGYYELKEKIGAGGMGEVYKAVDTRLNRVVALKFLSESLENDSAAKRRLVKEAQAVAMLEHPNICAVHSIEQSDEHHFIVMQYIEGKTLAESIAHQPLTVEKFKSLARQIITAVAFAHSHGVIHRDLKPGNIMLNSDGQIKVLDFGLAKVIPQKSLLGHDSKDEISRFSQNGVIIGTVAYMSPEQLRGEKLDYRSDVFSVGIILYELLAKQNPFNRKSQAETIAAILSADAVNLKKFAPDFPEILINLVEKCLQKEKEDRFQSAAEILVELDKAETANVREIISKRSKKIFLKILLAAAVLLAAWTGIFFFYTTKPEQRSLAILPISFDNPLPEKEYLADGLTQSIIDKLSSLSGLKVKSEAFIARYKGKSVEPQTVGRELNVDAVYVGSIAKREDSLFLTSKLVRTSDGFVIDSDELKIEESKLIELQENISARIINKIKTNQTDDKNKLAKKDTENEEAKRLYLRGRFYLGRRQGEDLKNAERHFREATNLDPSYAKAWAGLADTYSLYSLPGHKGSMLPDEAVKSARAAAKTALEIDDSLCEPYNSLAMIKLRYEWDWKGAESYFRAAISRNPEFPSARLGLSNLLIIKGEFAEAIEEAKKAKEFSPFSVSADLSMAGAYYFKRDYEQMDRVLSESLKNFPNHKRLNYLLGLQLLKTNKINAASEIFEKMYHEDKVLAAAPLGFIYGKTGRKDETLKILSTLEELSKKNGEDYIPSQEKAIIYLGLGELNKAFDNLTKACNERFPALPFVVRDPIFDEIKSDARFSEIKKCVNL